MAYKQKPMTFGEGTDLTKKTGLGPRADKKVIPFDEKEDATLEAMENSSKWDGEAEMEIAKAKKKKKLAADKASNKKRSDAERALEAKEDAEGK